MKTIADVCARFLRPWTEAYVKARYNPPCRRVSGCAFAACARDGRCADDPPILFPDHPVRLTKPAVFDDRRCLRGKTRYSCKYHELLTCDEPLCDFHVARCTRMITMTGEKHVCGVDGPCNGLPRDRDAKFFSAHAACKAPYTVGFGVENHYQCKCHERMGNEFWFLPSDRCLYEDEPRAPAMPPRNVHPWPERIEPKGVVTVDGVQREHNGRMLGEVVKPGDPGYRSGSDEEAKRLDAIKARPRYNATPIEYAGVKDNPKDIQRANYAEGIRREAIEACRRVALEQRCVRGTTWDLACVAIANAIGRLNDPPYPAARMTMDEIKAAAVDSVVRGLRCDHCGSTAGVTSNLAFDLCPACTKLLREEHESYAARGLKARDIRYTPRRPEESYATLDECKQHAAKVLAPPRASPGRWFAILMLVVFLTFWGSYLVKVIFGVGP